MPRVRAHTLVPGPLSAAEALWHDLRRWPSFVDGLARIDKTEGQWPEPGARVVWSGPPGEAARVVERSERLVLREGHVVSIEDEQVLGTRSVAFAPAQDGLVRVSLELEVTAKPQAGRTAALGRLLLGRRRREGLERTLTRFRIERMSDVDDAL